MVRSANLHAVWDPPVAFVLIGDMGVWLDPRRGDRPCMGAAALRREVRDRAPRAGSAASRFGAAHRPPWPATHPSLSIVVTATSYCTGMMLRKLFDHVLYGRPPDSMQIIVHVSCPREPALHGAIWNGSVLRHVCVQNFELDETIYASIELW